MLGGFSVPFEFSEQPIFAFPSKSKDDEQVATSFLGLTSVITACSLSLFPQLVPWLDGQSAQLAVVDRRWASVDKAASAAIFLEDPAPVGILSTLLVASVAESSKYCFWARL